eukprot:6206706-Pleurochrysis_carterae.AAC.1
MRAEWDASPPPPPTPDSLLAGRALLVVCPQPAGQAARRAHVAALLHVHRALPDGRLRRDVALGARCARDAREMRTRSEATGGPTVGLSAWIQLICLVHDLSQTHSCLVHNHSAYVWHAQSRLLRLKLSHVVHFSIGVLVEVLARSEYSAGGMRAELETLHHHCLALSSSLNPHAHPCD